MTFVLFDAKYQGDTHGRLRHLKNLTLLMDNKGMSQRRASLGLLETRGPARSY